MVELGLRAPDCLPWRDSDAWLDLDAAARGRARVNGVECRLADLGSLLAVWQAHVESLLRRGGAVSGLPAVRSHAPVQSLETGAGALALDLDRVRGAVADSTAPNTRRNYAGCLRRLAAWLDDRGLDLWALDPDQQDAAIAAWLAHRADGGAAPATIALDHAAVGAAARDQRRDDPRGPITRRTLRGLRRQAARADDPPGRGQVDALRWRAVEAAAVLAASDGSPAGLRDAALLRLGSDGFLRVSELAAARWQDLDRADDGSGRLTIRTSKTDQDGRGSILFVGPPTLAAVDAWRAVLGGAGDGPMFRRLGRGGQPHPSGAGLTTASIRRIVARRAADAGVEGRISGHSLRVGSAQSIVRAGGSTAELMQTGRWRDARTASGYAKAELAGRGAVARLRYGAGQ